MGKFCKYEDEKKPSGCRCFAAILENIDCNKKDCPYWERDDNV